MRVDQLITALEDIRSVLAAGQAGAADRDLKCLIQLLGDDADTDVTDAATRLETAVSAVMSPAVDRVDVVGYVSKLKAASDNEGSMKVVLKELSADPSVKKEHAVEIAKAFGTIRIDDKSKTRAIDSIEKYFYWLLYQRDAGAMARRATPW